MIRGIGPLLVAVLLWAQPEAAAAPSFLVSPSDAAPYGLIPRTGTGEVWVRGASVAETTPGASFLAADVRVGLPWRTSLRLTAPLVVESGRLGMASPALGAGTEAGLRFGEEWLATLFVELEVRAPAPGVPSDLRLFGRDPATEFWELGGNTSLSFLWVPKGLAFRLSFGGGGAIQQVRGELGYGLTDELFVQAGVAKLLPGDWQGSAGLVYLPRWMPDSTWTLYAASPFSREPPHVGLAFGLSFDLGSTGGRPEVKSVGTEGDVAEVGGTSRESQLSMLAVPGKVTAVVFGASWCPPCGPLLQELREQAAEDARLSVRYVNVDANPSFAEAQKVSALPHVAILGPDGTLVRSGTLTAAEVRAALEESTKR
jgi:thiol-disulfide isomerase/thioredoxin